MAALVAAVAGAACAGLVLAAAPAVVPLLTLAPVAAVVAVAEYSVLRDPVIETAPRPLSKRLAAGAVVSHAGRCLWAVARQRAARLRVGPDVAAPPAGWGRRSTQRASGDKSR